jgi:dihydroorotase
MTSVFRALLVCAEGDCAEVFEAYGSLEELEALACDCGCSLELLEISETDEQREGFELIPLR